MIEFKIDDIYKARPMSRQLEEAAGNGFMTTNSMAQKQSVVPRLETRAPGHVYYGRLDSLRRGAEHSNHRSS